jgi:deoxyribodipyrimidine photo-lyase
VLSAVDQPYDAVNNTTTIWWIRRDIRVEDNAALYYALKEKTNVLPLFIFDTNILDALEETHDKRVDFIHQSIFRLKQQLEELGSSLLVFHGRPADIFKRLDPGSVYANHDYEPYALERDTAIATILSQKGIPFKTFKDQVIFEKNEIVKQDGSPYTIYTPYSRKWKEKLNAFYIKSYPSERKFKNLGKIKPLPFPTLKDLGFESTGSKFPMRVIKTSIIKQYHQQRDFPAVDGTTRLSVHLRFGTVSIRKLVQLAIKENETWLNELIWREFYQMILWHYPAVVSKSFKPAYDHIEWRNAEKEFMMWCEGKTGYPIVDAGMRELQTTGFMHNRVRMIAASFLTKHLLIDWRWGEAYFAKKLLDYELASNNGGWQWAAGSGSDAVPYFRIFNPFIQAKKFDPEMKYIRKWIPELTSGDYPSPIVDHKMARERALKTYKAVLREVQ